MSQLDKNLHSTNRVCMRSLDASLKKELIHCTVGIHIMEYNEFAYIAYNKFGYFDAK